MSFELVRQARSYAEPFRQVLIRSRGFEPAWLTKRRAEAFEYFERVGFPTVREEDWKYTNVSPIARTDFAPEIQAASARSLNGHAKAFFYEEARNSRLAFINGIFQRDLSSVAGLPDSVVVADLADLLRQPQHEERLREHFKQNRGQNAFPAMNMALFTSGAFVLIPRGVEVKTPIHLLFISQAQNGGASASFPRVLIMAEENSSATIVENYVGIGEGVYFTNAVVDVAVKSGAHIQHYKVQRESGSAFHIAATSATTERNSRYDTTNVNLGAALSRHGIDVTLDDEGGQCSVDT